MCLTLGYLALFGIDFLGGRAGLGWPVSQFFFIFLLARELLLEVGVFYNRRLSLGDFFLPPEVDHNFRSTVNQFLVSSRVKVFLQPGCI